MTHPDQQTKRTRIRIPSEIYSRLDDVSYYLPSEYWDELSAEQQARVREEAEHLIDLINSGDNWYDCALQAGRDRYLAKRFLKRIN